MSAYGGRGPEIVGVSWALAGVTTIIISLRTYVRYGMRRRAGQGYSWDLWWAYLAWTMGIFGMSFMSISCYYGLGNHLDIVIERGDIEKALLNQWVWSSCSALMIAVAKFSVVAFLLNIQGPTHATSRYIMYALVGIGFAANLACEPLIWLQCDPPRKLWQLETAGSCSNKEAAFYLATFSGSWGALADLYLAVYPVVLIYRLEISKRLKVFLCGLMGLGLFTAVCSIAKTYELYVLKGSEDATYDSTSLALWAIAESWVMLIASGIPATWPLFQKLLEQLNLSARLHIVTTMLLRSFQSPRRSSSSGDNGEGSRYSASTRGVPMTQAHAFASLGDSSERIPSISKDAVTVTKGLDVQHENAPAGTYSTYGSSEMRIQ